MGPLNPDSGSVRSKANIGWITGARGLRQWEQAERDPSPKLLWCPTGLLAGSQVVLQMGQAREEPAEKDPSPKLLGCLIDLFGMAANVSCDPCPTHFCWLAGCVLEGPARPGRSRWRKIQAQSTSGVPRVSSTGSLVVSDLRQFFLHPVASAKHKDLVPSGDNFHSLIYFP